MKAIKNTKEEARISLMRDAAEDLYTALKMVLAASDNRQAIIAVENAKLAILKADGNTIES